MNLEYRNNWESHVYSAEGISVQKIKTVKINGEEYPVKSKRDHRSYSDHGHTYSSQSVLYYIELEVEGMPGTIIKLNLHDIMEKHTVVLHDWVRG